MRKKKTGMTIPSRKKYIKKIWRRILLSHTVAIIVMWSLAIIFKKQLFSGPIEFDDAVSLALLYIGFFSWFTTGLSLNGEDADPKNIFRGDLEFLGINLQIMLIFWPPLVCIPLAFIFKDQSTWFAITLFMSGIGWFLGYIFWSFKKICGEKKQLKGE